MRNDISKLAIAISYAALLLLLTFIISKCTGMSIDKLLPWCELGSIAWLFAEVSID